MSQHFLNASQVCSTLEKVSCKAMTKSMRCNAPARRKGQAKSLNEPLNVASAEPASVNTHEQRTVSIGFGFPKTKAFTLRYIISDRTGGEVPERNQSFLSTLAEDFDQLLRH